CDLASNDGIVLDLPRGDGFLLDLRRGDRVLLQLLGAHRVLAERGKGCAATDDQEDGDRRHHVGVREPLAYLLHDLTLLELRDEARASPFAGQPAPFQVPPSKVKGRGRDAPPPLASNSAQIDICVYICIYLLSSAYAKSQASGAPRRGAIRIARPRVQAGGRADRGAGAQGHRPRVFARRTSRRARSGGARAARDA